MKLTEIVRINITSPCRSWFSNIDALKRPGRLGSGGLRRERLSRTLWHVFHLWRGTKIHIHLINVISLWKRHHVSSATLHYTHTRYPHLQRGGEKGRRKLTHTQHTGHLQWECIDDSNPNLRLQAGMSEELEVNTKNCFFIVHQMLTCVHTWIKCTSQSKSWRDININSQLQPCMVRIIFTSDFFKFSLFSFGTANCALLLTFHKT